MDDYMVRATAADGRIRAFAAYTKNTAETARAAHNTSPVVTAALGRLLTAGAMMGSMMKGDKDLLTLRINGDGPLRTLLVTADSHGNVKGYPGEPCVLLPANSAGKLDVAGAVGAGTLTVIKDMGMKEPYSGTCELATGEIAEDITYYFASSEQTPASVGLGVLMTKENTVNVAGGFIIQVMPDISEETIEALEQSLSGVKSVTSLLERGVTPEELLDMLLGGLGLEILDTMPVRFKCNCSKERVSNALSLLGEDDISSVIESGEPIEVKCHFCNTAYSFEPEELAGLHKL
ncbi:MAG: Hsp33 family molecular chaperone HslO [Butyrivibrio sp.]|nr:Hsp33 family molecular chaperone HslO [Butyrivibrio sp.]